MADDTARLAADLLEAWNTHSAERVVPFYAPDYEGVDVAEAVTQHGLRGIEHTLRRYLDAFPDLRFTGEDTVVQGDRVALIWRARGTHLGPLMRIPPTGRAVEVRGVSLLTLKDNKVTRAVYIWDVAALLRAIGLLPEL
jgi:steroid delta-isomerase-like uncharacterized protein